MVDFIPLSLSLALSRSGSVGICGSRSIVPPAALWSAFTTRVPRNAVVSCGCVNGVCALVRASFLKVHVFSASSYGRGRGAYAARSIALVRSVASGYSPVWVSFPGRACPSGLVPSPVSSKCFCGLGSGSWASLALAIGLGVQAFVWLPVGIDPPIGWGFIAHSAGWWSSESKKG